MNRRRLIAVFLPVLAILLVAGVFYTLLHTGPGARWIWQRVVNVVPGELRAVEVSGDLQSGLRFRQLRYRNGTLMVTADRVGLRLDVDLLPPSLAVHRLEFGSLEISTGPGGEEETGSVQGALAALALPVPVEFQVVRGERLAWRAGGEEPALELRSLAFSASWFRQLEVRDVDLSVAAPAMHLQGGLELALQPPFAIALTAAADFEPDPELGLDKVLELSLGIEGELDALRVQAQAKEPAVALQGTLEGLSWNPVWDLQLSAERLLLPIGAPDPAVLVEALTASSYGWIEGFGLELEGQVSGPGLEGLRARVVGAGDASGLRIERLEANADALALEGTGRLDWRAGFAADGSFDVERFDPAPWFEPWGEAEAARGHLDLAWRDGTVEFTTTDLSAPGTVEKLAGAGTYHSASGTFDAKLDWQGLSWAPGAAAPDFVSQTGTANLGGRIDGWRLAADLDLAAADLPTGRLRLDGSGNADGMALEIPRAEVLGGSLAGRFEMRWSPERPWSATARFSDLSTTPFTPAWPARVSGDAALRGRLEPWELEADIAGLNGTLRDRPVTARGKLMYRDGRLVAQGVDVNWAGAALSLDGDPGTADGLAFQVDIESLGDLDEGAAGSLAGSGRVSLAPDSPFLVLDLQSADLAWAGYTAETVRATTSPGADAELRIEALGLRAGQSQVDSLALVTDSRQPLDRVEAEAALAGMRVELGLSGAVVDWGQLLAGGWRGSLQHFRLDEEALGWIELEEAADLSVQSSAATLSRACFRGSRQGRLCLEGRWTADAGRMLDASLENVSPNLALRLADSDLAFTQLLSGTLAWRQHGTADPEATVDLNISKGAVQIEGEDEPILETGPGRFGFQMADGQLFAGNLDIPMPGYGAIDTDFSAPDLSEGLSSPLQGRLQVNLKDIAPVLQLTTAIEGSSGPVAADMRFSGTIADPRFTGHVSLVRGRISHFATGLLLENLQLAGAVYEFDQTELLGTFRAGEGQGSIRAVVNFDNILEPSVLVELQGEKLTLINVPDLNVTADPDVRVIWREGGLDLDGRIKVPSARLSPRFLPTSGAAESPDVVIVAGVDPHARPEQPAAALSIHGKLELELGDDVRLQLERAQARLSGTARFKWNGPLVPVATGGFDLNGDIYAYGQSLQVTEGRISFANRPADNPFLTIRAEREIFGNSQVRRAGVLVTGSLKQPLLETYTDPMTTRERALALLVTGNDFDYEQGVGAVEVGMYVAPRLFISYGVGLFDNQNVISARYDLGRGFGVKATSGQRETGVDISYTVER